MVALCLLKNQLNLTSIEERLLPHTTYLHGQQCLLRKTRNKSQTACFLSPDQLLGFWAKEFCLYGVERGSGAIITA